MAVMTHASIPQITLPAAAHYNQLAANLQAKYDQHIEDADNAPNEDSFKAALADAAHTVGIAVPVKYVIVRCDCFDHGCQCDLVFPANLDGAHVVAPANGGNLDRLQCDGCAHDHPRTDA